MLIKILNKFDITQREFAHRLGVRPSLVTYWISGQRKPQVDTVIKICKTFDVSADWLLGLTESEG